MGISLPFGRKSPQGAPGSPEGPPSRPPEERNRVTDLLTGYEAEIDKGSFPNESRREYIKKIVGQWLGGVQRKGFAVLQEREEITFPDGTGSKPRYRNSQELTDEARRVLDGIAGRNHLDNPVLQFTEGGFGGGVSMFIYPTGWQELFEIKLNHHESYKQPLQSGGTRLDIKERDLDILARLDQRDMDRLREQHTLPQIREWDESAGRVLEKAAAQIVQPQQVR